MSLLSYDELRELRDAGVITNVTDDMINSASIDITLGNDVMVEHMFSEPPEIHLSTRTPLYMYNTSTQCGYKLKPGQFILAQSEQVFNLPPDISAEYKLKSSMARIGLNHALAGWCDAGWHGSVLTLELKNWTENHTITLTKGDRIGQMIFFRHKEVRHENSYAARGRYNNDKQVSGVKL